MDSLFSVNHAEFVTICLCNRRYFLVLGMKPLLYSERGATVGGLGWKRVGFNISYYKTSSYKNPLLQREYAYYTLTFYMVSFFLAVLTLKTV